MQFLLQLVTQALTIKLIVSKKIQKVTVISGKEKSEVGRIKSVVANPCKSANETFTKFITNALGDPYVDPGKYNQ